jgi:flagellar basal-body rod protein FlgG
MLEGLYSAASGMEAQQTQLDAISNDVANTDTPGYQASVVGFHDLLYNNDGDQLTSVTVGSGAGASVVGFSQLQGSIEQTGNPLDVAIQGNAYLEVHQPNGTIGLTRNGTLQINGEGQLTTTLGMPLQPPITLPKGTQPSDVSIASDGTVSVKGAKVGTISLVTVPGPDQLLPSGNSIFTPTVASGAAQPASGATLEQGALEASNVDINSEMTQMMSAEQSYDLASKAMSFETQMAQIASTIKSS